MHVCVCVCVCVCVSVASATAVARVLSQKASLPYIFFFGWGGGGRVERRGLLRQLSYPIRIEIKTYTAMWHVPARKPTLSGVGSF